MINVLLIAPYMGFATEFARFFEEHSQTIGRAEYDRETYRLDSVIAGGLEELPTLRFDAEVIVSRGFVARDLLRKDYYVPVVEVPVAASDLVQCLHKAHGLYHCNRIAVVGSTNMVMGAERLSEVVGMQVEQHALANREEIDECVDEIAAVGIRVVIGGVKTCERARKLGLHTLMLESGREAMWHSITEAKRLGYIAREEEKKAQNLKAIFDNVVEGIIALDNDGKVEVLNPAAERILTLGPERAIGRPITQVMPFAQVNTLMENTRGESHAIIKYEGGTFTVNSAPILVRDEKLGSLLILQDSEHILELEKKIREKIYRRGHVTKHTFEDIIGESAAIKGIIQNAKKYSAVDSNIVIVGETGTGKELFAQSIHSYSRRRDGPFVAVNCAALSESLLESELFGYAEGAFTGAARGGKPGLFELAHRGTLFLDEISEIPSPLQGRLLRAIQEKEIRRLGDDRVIPVDVRIISASNRRLSRLVEERVFRQDLYYRLDILELELPPLRDRREDIPALAQYWARKYGFQFKMEEMKMSARATEFLSRYDWPGNIRQLRNICERLVVLSHCSVIDAKDVELVLDPHVADLERHVLPKPVEEAGQTSAAPVATLHREIKEIERDRILRVLREVSFNKLKAASLLGMSRTTLWRRMKEMNVQ